MDGATLHRQGQKSDSCHCKNVPCLSGVTHPFALNPIYGLESQVAHENINNNDGHV